MRLKHGRRSSKGFGEGALNFYSKMTWFIDLIHWMSKLNKLQRKKKKSLYWNWDGFVNMKLPKILTQTCPKNMKWSKILTRNRHFKTKRVGGGTVPPPPPSTPMAWRKNCKKNFILAWVSTSIVYNRNKSQRCIKNDWMQIYRHEKFPCKAEISK